MFFKGNKKIKFSDCLWQHVREKRRMMVDDLVKQKILLNLNKQEVLDLLGFEFNDSNSNTWTYYIDRRRFVFSSKRYLSIFFDNKGLVYKTTFS